MSVLRECAGDSTARFAKTTLSQRILGKLDRKIYENAQHNKTFLSLPSA
jgi:hypothetical protein